MDGKVYVLGNPPASVVAFASRDPRINIHEVGDKMSKKGWHLNGIVNPNAIHIAVTVRPRNSHISPELTSVH